MNSLALSLSNRLHIPLPTYRPHQPFFDALKHIEYGRLAIITPEGNILEFSGSHSGPAAHLKLYDWEVLDDLVARGEMGLAKAYVNGRWGSENLPDLLTFGLMNSPALERFLHGNPWYALLSHLRYRIHENSVWQSRKNIMAHYDLGNNFYKLWLDESMTYSCALFEDDANRSLEDAQAAKYQRVLNKLAARPGDHILDIGCGWGGFAEAAARRGLRVTAITLSETQAQYARERLTLVGLQYLVSVELMDYRKISGLFDHIVSIGMFEHVGEHYWRTYFETIKRNLRPGGKALIQSITLDDKLFETLQGYSGFIEQVIFPGGMLPSQSRFRSTAWQAGLECLEIFTFGKDYARTAQHWLNRFHAQREEVKALGYDDSFLRLWKFYLSACIAAFTSRRTDVMQAELIHA